MPHKIQCLRRSYQKGMDYMQTNNNNSASVVGVQKRHATKKNIQNNLENKKIIRKHCSSKSWITYLSK